MSRNSRIYKSTCKDINRGIKFRTSYLEMRWRVFPFSQADGVSKKQMTSKYYRKIKRLDNRQIINEKKEMRNFLSIPRYHLWEIRRRQHIG